MCGDVGVSVCIVTTRNRTCWAPVFNSARCWQGRVEGLILNHNFALVSGFDCFHSIRSEYCFYCPGNYTLSPEIYPVLRTQNGQDMRDGVFVYCNWWSSRRNCLALSSTSLLLQNVVIPNIGGSRHVQGSSSIVVDVFQVRHFLWRWRLTLSKQRRYIEDTPFSVNNVAMVWRVDASHPRQIRHSYKAYESNSVWGLQTIYFISNSRQRCIHP